MKFRQSGRKPNTVTLYGLRDVILRPYKGAPIGPSGHKYWHLSTGMRFRRFKWQWRITYEINLDGEWLRQISDPMQSRRVTRSYKSHLPYGVRNVKVQRRLIEVDWHDYNDSYGWNRGNGKR